MFATNSQMIKSRNSLNFNAIAKGIQRSFEKTFMGGQSVGGYSSGGLSNGEFGHHEEQLSHYQGYTYAIIRLIANRICGQPLCAARIQNKQDGDVPEESVSRIHRIQSKKMSLVYAKQYLPNCFKNKASNLDILEDHEVIDLFEDPNPIMTKYILMYMTIASLELTGKAYWLLRKGEETKSGKPEIWFFPASWITPIHEDDELFAKWEVAPPGYAEPVYYPGEEMVYFYFPNPADPIGATSPLQAMANSVLSDESIEVTNRKAFSNGCNPGLALMVGRPPEMGSNGPDRPFLTKEQRAQIIAAVKAQYRGVLNADEPLILDGLIQDAKRITTSPREMDFLNSGKATKGRLAQGWGVNPISMGEIEGANYASSAAADQHLLGNVINPRIEFMSQVLTRSCRKFFQDDSLVVYLEKARSVDPDFELRRDQAMYQNGAISINEWRAEHGKPPIQGGDVAYFQGRVVSLIPEPQQDVRRVRPMGRKGFQSVASVLGVDGMGDAYLRQIDGLKSNLVQDIQKFLIEMGERAKMHIGLNLKMNHNPSLVVDHAFNDHEWFQKLKETVQPHLLQIAMTGAIMEYGFHTKSYSQFVTKGLMDSLKSIPSKIASNVASFIGNLFNLDYWKGIIGSSKNKIIVKLDQSIKEGDYGQSAADAAINDVFSPSNVISKADSIAETESAAAMGGGQHESRIELARQGIVTRKQWWTKLDNKVREYHQGAHGQIVGVLDQFYVGGEYCDYPKDPRLSAGNRINCRCVVLSLP